MKNTSCMLVAALVAASAAASGWAQDQVPNRPRARPRVQQDGPPPMRESGGERGGPADLEPGAPPREGFMPGDPGAQPRPGPRGGDPMLEGFFPPELVMQNQGILDLTADQRTAIREAMQKSLSRVTDLQWQQGEESAALNALTKAGRVDEAKVMSQLDKVLAIESEMKHLHLGLMIKIKNTLTPEQQARLNELMQSARPPRLPGGADDARPMRPGPGLRGDREQNPGGPDRGPQNRGGRGRPVPPAPEQ